MPAHPVTSTQPLLRMPTPPAALMDSHGREFRYLRLSVTDACNFKCVYCLPDGYRRQQPAEEPLSLSEVTHLVSAFGLLGFRKVRLTGGEPTLRRDIVEIVRRVAAVEGIETIALSTNGYRLASLAAPLKQAGLQSLNVSLDSLDADRFERITGKGNHAEILRGIDRALEEGFTKVKINTVLLKGMNEEDLSCFMEWVRKRPVAVRFIELMRTGRNQELFTNHYLCAGDIQQRLRVLGWMPRQRSRDDGPALEYEHPDYLGRIGLIAPYSKDFCQTCNRLRISSTGKLRLCLFGEADYSLRPWMDAPESVPVLAEKITSLVVRKPESHYLHEGLYGNTWNLAAIGG